MTVPTELVGVVPAAGASRRSASLPCSKEVVPLGLDPSTGDGRPAVARVACTDLLTAMHRAGARRAVVVIRPGKWDIPAFLGDGAHYGLRLAYVPFADSPGVPWSVRHALPFAEQARIVFGFPDITVRPRDALARVVEQQTRTGAAVVLGLFPAHHPEQVDMVAVEPNGRVRGVEIKPRTTRLRWTWLLACWTPAFSDFLASKLIGTPAKDADDGRVRECHLGDILQGAVADGWLIQSVTFHEGAYRDVGTPNGLADALLDERDRRA